MDACPTEVAVESSRSTRDRKQVERLTTGVIKERILQIVEGGGILLADYPYFIACFEKLRTDDEVCKHLHLMLFGTLGTKSDRKRNIRKFSGFANENIPDKIVKFIEKKAFTVSLLKVTISLHIINCIICIS